MSDREPARTMFASKAVTVSTAFAARFRDLRLGGRIVRRVQVQSMDVETTGHGQQARMAISLVEDGQDAARAYKLVCGWLDVKNDVAKFRNFATLAKMWQGHSGDKLDMPREEYQNFLQQAEAFLKENGVFMALFDEEQAWAEKTGPRNSVAQKGSTAVQGWSTFALAVASLIGMGVGFILGRLTIP